MEDNNEVYLKDQNGNVITPADLPTSIKDLSNDPFRGLAGAVRESCGFEKRDKSSSAEDEALQGGGVATGPEPWPRWLEFRWADYLRAHWPSRFIADSFTNILMLTQRGTEG